MPTETESAIGQRIDELAQSTQQNFLSETKARDALAGYVMEHLGDMYGEINQLALRVQGIEAAVLLIIETLEDNGLASLSDAREALSVEVDDAEDR